jgi:hypothetical protein
LAHTLALELRSAFFFNPLGAVVGGGVGIGLAILPVWIQHRRKTPPWETALSLLPLLLPAVDLLSGPFRPWRGPVLLIGSLSLMACSLWFLPSAAARRRIGFALAILIPLAVYLPDLSPYVGRADTFEFQVVAPRLGIAHPSGYPLYILIGKLFSLLPLESAAWRINLSSAVFAALAAGMLFLALTERGAGIGDEGSGERLSPDRGLQSTDSGSRIGVYVGLIAALALAFSPTLWSRAIEAEVYALNAFMVALGLWLAVRRTAGALRAGLAAPAFGLLTGVAMASHITLGALLLLAAPLIFTVRPRPRFRALLYAAGLGLAGLAIYLYIPIRWPAVNRGEMMTLAHFLSFVTNAESGGALHPLAFAQDPSRWALVFRLLRMQVGWAGVALAAVGLPGLARRQWPLALGTALAFAAWVWFNLSFYVADPDYSAFLIPGHVVLIYWMGMGIRLGATLPRQAPAPLTSYVLLPLLALLPLSRLWITGPTLDTLSQGRADEAWGRYALHQPLATGAAILADSEKFPPLYYLQQVEGIRPDLELVTLFSEAQYREALETRLRAGQHVYMARYLPGLDAFGVSSVGPLVEVRPSQPAGALTQSVEAHFGDALVLDHDCLEADPEGRRMHHLILVWHTVAPVGGDLAVGLRLVSPKGEAVIWKGEATRPVMGYTTTEAWGADIVVQDYHPLVWPGWLPAGVYRLEVALFPRFTEQGLHIDDGDQVWLPLEELTVPRQEAAPLPKRLDVLYADHLWLESVDVPGETWAEAPMTIDLSWLWQASATANASTLLRWVPADGQPLPTLTLEAHGEDAPPPVGQRSIRRYTITAPPTPGRYRLEIGWTDGESMDPARCGWLGRRRDTCAIGEVHVGPSNVGLANFANQILLLDAELDAGGVPAGGPLSIDLRWRDLRAMDRDYTVFVQIVGPDGKLYGQADSWPVQGARPTGGWAVGEEISDPYRLNLAADAPPGRYQVIVGWYLLADMSRLPVVDAGGRAVGDFYVVGAITLPSTD